MFCLDVVDAIIKEIEEMESAKGEVSKESKNTIKEDDEDDEEDEEDNEGPAQEGLWIESKANQRPSRRISRYDEMVGCLSGDVKGRTVIVFDDMIDTGNTLRFAMEVCL